MKKSKKWLGGFINCWVKAKDETTAKDKAIKYINTQGWEVLNIDEIDITIRERYSDESDSLECYDQAINLGIGAIFYTWPIDGDNEM